MLPLLPDFYWEYQRTKKSVCVYKSIGSVNIWRKLGKGLRSVQMSREFTTKPIRKVYDFDKIWKFKRNQYKKANLWKELFTIAQSSIFKMVLDDLIVIDFRLMFTENCTVYFWMRSAEFSIYQNQLSIYLIQNVPIPRNCQFLWIMCVYVWFRRIFTIVESTGGLWVFFLLSRIIMISRCNLFSNQKLIWMGFEKAIQAVFMDAWEHKFNNFAVETFGIERNLERKMWTVAWRLLKFGSRLLSKESLHE